MMPFTPSLAAVAPVTNLPCVLIVDDDRVTRFAVSRLLVGGGYHVLEAARICEAKKLLAIHPVKAMIVDGLLPDGTGLDFITELRKEGNDTPVFFVSSFFKDLHSWATLRRELHVAAVLPKPFSPEQLVSILKQALTVEQMAAPEMPGRHVA
jgi:DNA-binding response OmpR family regulator